MTVVGRNANPSDKQRAGFGEGGSVILRDLMVVAQRPLDAFGASLEARSRVICSLISLSLEGKICDVGFWRVAIHANWTDKNTDMKIIGGVFMYPAEIDAETLSSVARAEENANFLLLDWLCSVLRDVFSDFGLHEDLISEAYAFVQKRSFENYFSGPSTHEPSGPRKANIQVVQTPDAAKVFLVVQEGKKEVARIPLAEEHPDEFRFQIYLEPVIWQSESTIVLRRADGREFVLNVPSIALH